MSTLLSTHPALSMLHLPSVRAWQIAGQAVEQPIRFPHHCSPAQSNPFENRMDNPHQLRGARKSAAQSWGEGAVGNKDQDGAGSHSLIVMNQHRTDLLAQDLVILKHRARQSLTAVHTIDGELRLFSWRVNADGSVLRTGSSRSIGPIRQVQVVYARNYVIACRTQAGELQLSRWDVSNTGAIYPAGESKAALYQIQWVEMAALTPDRIATFVLTEQHTWQLVLWQLHGDDALAPLQSAELPAAPISTCALAVLPAENETLRLVTILSETPARLTFHLWHYRPGQGLQRVASDSIHFPEAATIKVTHTNQDQVIAVVQTVDSRLHLLSWRLPGDAQAPFCQETILVSEGVGHCTWQKRPDGFVLISRMLTGEIQVHSWRVSADRPMSLIGAGRAPVVATGEVISCTEPLEGNAPFFTALVGEQGEVTLLTWRLL